jgi:hypothetical protein
MSIVHTDVQQEEHGLLGQWYSTWGTHTRGGMRRHLRGYVKLKILVYYFMISKLIND